MLTPRFFPHAIYTIHSFQYLQVFFGLCIPKEDLWQKKPWNRQFESLFALTVQLSFRIVYSKNILGKKKRTKILILECIQMYVADYVFQNVFKCDVLYITKCHDSHPHDHN